MKLCKGPILCIYHKDCADGFGAALAVETWCQQSNIAREFIPAHYGDTPPDVTDKNVIIVDFSYPRDVLLAMNEQAEALLVIDHHKSAQEALAGLDFCIFDMDKSGAVLAWETLQPEREVPLLFQYIQDRDLWQWKLPNSKAISAALSITPMEFDIWTHYFNQDNIRQLENSGQAILGYQQAKIKKAIVNPSMVNIAGYNVPCINTTTLISEICGELAVGHPFAAVYFETAEHRVYSLRSTKDGIDVSEVAKQFGGGGHVHAAGFKVAKPTIDLRMTISNNGSGSD